MLAGCITTKDYLFYKQANPTKKSIFVGFSCGIVSEPQLGRGVMEEQQRQILVLLPAKELAFPALAQSLAGSWRFSEWFGEAPGNFKILSGKGERVLNI